MARNNNTSPFRTAGGAWLLLLSLILCSWPEPVSAARIAYRLTPGVTYTYLMKEQCKSSSQAGDVQLHDGDSTVATISIAVIAVRDDATVMDIQVGNVQVRRYLRSNGSLVGAPSETGANVPFLLEFPTTDWVPGTVHSVKRTMRIGKQTVPLQWQCLLDKQQPKPDQYTIKLQGTAALPSDRVIQRSLTIKGSLLFDATGGIPLQGTWVMTYSFVFQNKEVAVIRPIWSFEEKRQYSFKLVEKSS